ncbi:MAG: hypothetical protein KGM99_16055 [Burkholderiales bacterium]|nr:hypothetical protein [Burkholderiales bacterium]
MKETRCSLALGSMRLQAHTVTLARCMHLETPAPPQTAFISDPFSAKRKLLRPQRGKVNTKTQYGCYTNFNLVMNQHRTKEVKNKKLI